MSDYVFGLGVRWLWVLAFCLFLYLPTSSAEGRVAVSDVCRGMESLSGPLCVVCSEDWGQWTRAKICAIWPEPLEEHECQNITNPELGCAVLTSHGLKVQNAWFCAASFSFRITQSSEGKLQHEELRDITIHRSSKNLDELWKLGLALVELVNSSDEQQICDTAQWHLDQSGKGNMFRCQSWKHLDKQTDMAQVLEMVISPIKNGWALHVSLSRMNVELVPGDPVLEGK